MDLYTAHLIRPSRLIFFLIYFKQQTNLKMASMTPTRDSFERTTLKTSQGATHLPSHQAKNIFVNTTDVVRTYSANATGNFSGYSEFVLDPNGLPNVVEKLTLALTLSAATKTGGTVISFVNGGEWLNRLIEVSIGSELVASIYPEAAYINGLLHKTTEDKFKTLVASGNDTLAHRQTRAAAGQTLYLDLSIPFIQKYGHLAASHSAQLRIKIFHSDLSSVIQTDGTAPVCSISSVALHVSGRQYIDQNSVTALVQMQRKLGKVSQRFLDVVQQQFLINSGSTSYTLQMTNLVGLFDHLYFVVRAAASTGTPLANAPDAFLAVQSFNMKDSAGNLTICEMPSGYALGPYLNKYVIGDATDIASGLGSVQKFVYPIFFGSRPFEAISKGTNHGFIKLDGLSKLQLTFGAAIGANYTIDVVGRVWSDISMDASGQVKKSVLS